MYVQGAPNLGRKALFSERHPRQEGKGPGLRACPEPRVLLPHSVKSHSHSNLGGGISWVREKRRDRTPNQQQLTSDSKATLDAQGLSSSALCPLHYCHEASPGFTGPLPGSTQRGPVPTPALNGPACSQAPSAPAAVSLARMLSSFALTGGGPAGAPRTQPSALQ